MITFNVAEKVLHLEQENIYTLHKREGAYCIKDSSMSSGQVERASGFLWGIVVEEEGWMREKESNGLWKMRLD